MSGAGDGAAGPRRRSLHLRVLLAVTAALPLTLHLYGGRLEQELPPVPLPVLILAQSAVLLAGGAALGL